MSYTPTPQYSFPASSYPPSATATPPAPPPKPPAPKHERAASATINYAATPPPPPPPPRPDSRAFTDTQDANHAEQRPESSYTMPGAPEAVGGVHTHEHYTQQPPQPTDNWLPQILLDKSQHDLHALLTNPSLQIALLHAPSTTHPSLPSSQQALHHALHTNATLASTLLPLLRHLTALRSQVSTHLSQCRALEQSYRLKQSELESKLEPWGPRALHARLVQSISEQEALCKVLEESWLEGEGVAGEREVGEWVRRVREGRSLVSLRRERRGRWDEGRVGGWR